MRKRHSWRAARYAYSYVLNKKSKFLSRASGKGRMLVVGAASRWRKIQDCGDWGNFVCVGSFGADPCADPRPAAPKRSEVPAPAGHFTDLFRVGSSAAATESALAAAVTRGAARGWLGIFFGPGGLSGPAPQRKYTHTLALLLLVERQVFCRRILKPSTSPDSLRPGLQLTRTSLLL